MRLPRRKAVIVPGGSDLNRGDQALVWEADALLRDSGVIDDVVMIGDGATGPDGMQTAQTEARGYTVMPSLLDSPRRGRHRQGDKIQDMFLSLVLLVTNSLADLVRSCGILLFARHPRLAGLFMSAEQQRTFEVIRFAEIIVVKGGGFLHAHGGIRAPYYIWFQLFYLRLAHRLGKPVVVLPNSFGPFEGWTVRRQVYNVLRKSRIVMARESISAAALEAILDVPVPVLPDLGYFLHAAPAEVGEEACRKAGVPLGTQPCVAFTVRPWRFPGTRTPSVHFTRYLTAIAALVRHVSELGFYPVLVSHVVGSGAHEDDRLALDELGKLLDGIPFSRVDHPGDCRDLKSIYGHMDYLVGTRFHSVVFAQGEGVPSLAVGYGGNKAAGIMQDSGLGEYVVPIEDVTMEVLRQKFDALVRNGSVVREAMSRWRGQMLLQRREMCALINEHFTRPSDRGTLRASLPAGEAPSGSSETRLVLVTTVPMTLKFFSGQIGYMKTRGFEVHAVSSPSNELERFGALEDIECHGVEMTRGVSPLRDLVALVRMVRLFHRIRPSIVHAHTLKGGLLGILAAGLARVPARIFHVHGFPHLTAQGSQRVLLLASERWASWFADRVLCVSASIRRVAIMEGICSAARITVLGNGSINGVDATGRFNPEYIGRPIGLATRASLGIPEDALVVGFVGRVVRIKGIVELAAAWTKLRARYPHLHLLIVGPFEKRDEPPSDIRVSLQNDRRVHLVGENWDTPRLYAAMDLVCLPTYREGLPVVPLEAAAMALPVVATHVPGCVDAVVDGITGKLVAPRDPEALAAAIRMYVDDSGMRTAHGVAGRALMLARFQPERIWELQYHTYVDLLKDKGLPIPLHRHDTPLSWVLAENGD